MYCDSWIGTFLHATWLGDVATVLWCAAAYGGGLGYHATGALSRDSHLDFASGGNHWVPLTIKREMRESTNKKHAWGIYLTQKHTSNWDNVIYISYVCVAYFFCIHESQKRWGSGGWATLTVSTDFCLYTFWWSLLNLNAWCPLELSRVPTAPQFQTWLLKL